MMVCGNWLDNNMPKLIDLSGQKFGEWTVIDLAGSSKYGSIWNCVCSCGNKKVQTGLSLRRKKTKRCSHCRGKSQRSKAGIVGTVFGKWTVIDAPLNSTTSLCKCCCGFTKLLHRGALVSRGYATCEQCARIEQAAMVGRIFYKWTVIEVVEVIRAGYKRVEYRCRCECGRENLISRTRILNLRTSQCRSCAAKNK